MSFNRTWDEYVSGFGDPGGNYWLGLDNLYRITGTATSPMTRLTVELESWTGDFEVAMYDNFFVGHRDTGYILMVSGFSGTYFFYS